MQFGATCYYKKSYLYFLKYYLLKSLHTVTRVRQSFVPITTLYLNYFFALLLIPDTTSLQITLLLNNTAAHYYVTSVRLTRSMFSSKTLPRASAILFVPIAGLSICDFLQYYLTVRLPHLLNNTTTALYFINCCN